MQRIIYSLLVCFFIAAQAFAIENGDTVYIDYDLQGGVNNPDNPAYFVYDRSGSETIYLLPPTKEGAEFIGWFETRNASAVADNFFRSAVYPYSKPNQASGNKFKLHARWGVVSKVPEKDDAGCLLIHNAAELYGAANILDTLRAQVCIFIEDDIVVNENLLNNNGTLNTGDYYWWKTFKILNGVIEGNGHTISGLYGNVGLVEKIDYYPAVIQNLGIKDSYFSGENPGAFVSTIQQGKLKLKNVYSTATVVGTSGYVGGLVGYADMRGDLCLDPAAPDPEPDRNPAAYSSFDDMNRFYMQIENSYSTGYLMGQQGGGLVGIADNILVKNSFYKGKIDITKTFSGIGLQIEKLCQLLSEGDVSMKNVFYPSNYTNSGFESAPASDTDFSNGTVLKKLKDSTEIPIWVQNTGDAYPKLNGAFYDITYRVHGGTNPSNPGYYTPNQEVVLKAAVKENDVFEGWFLDTNFTKPAQKIPSTAEGNQKYFARWESGYSITYVNDGNYKYVWKKNPTYRYADSSTYVLNEPTKDGYTFEGWFTDSTFKTRVTELVQGNKDDIVLIGKWNDGKDGIRKAIAPVPFKLDRARTYDIKGRSPKSRPNYGVYF